MTLPPMSELLLRLSIPHEFQAEILGDLTEEYDRRRAISERDARRWIRRDAVTAALSFPGAGLRMTAMIGVIAGAYLFTILWEVGFASPIARAAAPLGGAGAGFSWSAFLSIEMAGFALAAALAAAALYRPRQGLAMNVSLSAGPIALAVAAGPLVFALLRRDAGLILTRLDWIAASAVALAAGALAAAIIVRSQMVRNMMRRWRAISSR